MAFERLQSVVEQIRNSGVIEQVGTVANSEQVQQIISTGSADENYMKAVLIGEAIGRLSDTSPVVENFENNRYRIAWYGSELEKAQQFIAETSETALFSQGEPAPIVIDYFPVVKPMAIKYALPALLGAGGVCALIGYAIAKA